MTLARDAIGTGTPPETLRGLRVAAGAQLGVTAAGTNQATALAILATTGDVTVTTAAANTGVRLPTSAEGSQIGDEVTVTNGGANALNVFPGTGESINGLSANSALAVAVSTGVIARRRTATLWIVA